MTGPWHYRKAESLIRKGKDAAVGELAREQIMLAGVHAQLAAIAFEIEKLPVEGNRHWYAVIASEEFR